eukprot:3808977-Alexandrium_andersonii.AAC.1
MDQGKREAALREGVLHWEFALLLADYQSHMGNYYAIEHPAKALSWGNAKVQALLARDLSAKVVRFDMCCFGLCSK